MAVVTWSCRRAVHQLYPQSPVLPQCVRPGHEAAQKCQGQPVCGNSSTRHKDDKNHCCIMSQC